MADEKTVYLKMGDIKRLIALVKDERPIWDPNHKLYNNRAVLNRCWNDVAAKMSGDENALKKKWKYLRDQYSVELGKLLTGRVNARSHWSYFTALEFLKDAVKARPPKKESKIVWLPEKPTLNDPDGPRKIKEEPKDPEEEDDSSSSEDCTDFNASRLSLKRKSQFQFDLNTPPEVSHKKKTVLNCEFDGEYKDEDLCFFRSILTHVRKIPESDKLSFRNRILEVVSEYVYSKEMDEYGNFS